SAPSCASCSIRSSLHGAVSWEEKSLQSSSPSLNFAGRRRLPIVQQAEASECGLACLAMIAGWHGYDVDLVTLRRRFSVSLKGMMLRDLIAIASAIGLAARAVRCELSALGA